MMKSINLNLQNIGKRFNREWVFKGVNIQLNGGDRIAVLGSNGSGKSTIAKIMSGFVIPSEGSVQLTVDNKLIHTDQYYQYLSYTAPYLELPEEFTLSEMVNFQRKLRPFINAPSTSEIIQKLGMEKQMHKSIVLFSSGMKQRLKLLLALISEAAITILDEPTVNLDQQGIAWYRQLITECNSDKIIIVCSNHQSDEFDFCSQQLLIEEYKS
ncbi:MAG: ABC transporter ATP-binding protein [Bacteroidetes bacterium]|nr:ABC transporter ATP-binding protein [Bacteroidota bacterium]